MRGERELQVRASLMGIEVAVCGGDVGPVLSASVTGECVRDSTHTMYMYMYMYYIHV